MTSKENYQSIIKESFKNITKDQKKIELISDFCKINIKVINMLEEKNLLLLDEDKAYFKEEHWKGLIVFIKMINNSSFCPSNIKTAIKSLNLLYNDLIMIVIDLLIEIYDQSVKKYGVTSLESTFGRDKLREFISLKEKHKKLKQDIDNNLGSEDKIDENKFLELYILADGLIDEINISILDEKQKEEKISNYKRIFWQLVTGLALILVGAILGDSSIVTIFSNTY